MSSIPSPRRLSGSLTSFTIMVDGAAIPSTYQVDSIETFVAVNRLPKARLVIFDGSASGGDFPVSAANTFLPGNKITIAAGYDSNDALIFSGLIIGQSIKIDRTASAKLTVEIADQAMAMTLERNNAVFANIKDSDLIQKLITSSGLAANVTATTTVYEDLVQYYATDWDLMVMRAELNGFVVIADSGKVTVIPPNTQATPVLRVEYGDAILDLNAEMNATTQYKSSAIKSYAWDESTQKVLEAGPGVSECYRARQSFFGRTGRHLRGLDFHSTNRRHDSVKQPARLVHSRTSEVEALEDPGAGQLPGQRSCEDRQYDPTGRIGRPVQRAGLHQWG